MSVNSGGPIPSSLTGILAEVVRLQAAGRKGVLASPFWSLGSVPVSAWAKLLMRDDGSTLGTVGGGALEAEVLRAAPEVLREGRPRLLTFDLTASQAADAGMICGGRCAILLEPIAPGSGEEVFAAAARAEAAGEPIVIVTVLDAEAGLTRMAVRPGGAQLGTTGEATADEALVKEALAALAEGRPRHIEQPVTAHIEPLLPRPSLFIFGGGHIALPLAHMAEIIGFRVTVIDDREEFANRQRFPSAEQVVVAEVAHAFRDLRVGSDGYVVAVTRGHLMDEEVVAQALRTPARYIGMIGSKRKVAAVLDRLRQRGFSQHDLARVHAPIGLRIGADSVEEIAVSILAELIQERRRAAGATEPGPASHQPAESGP
jgi:xanthine dehydrogenase accessory factor